MTGASFFTAPECSRRSAPSFRAFPRVYGLNPVSRPWSRITLYDGSSGSIERSGPCFVSGGPITTSFCGEVIVLRAKLLVERTGASYVRRGDGPGSVWIELCRSVRTLFDRAYSTCSRFGPGRVAI
jgi:hypothetical protein